eukprot:Nk52_evm46s2192 gene=Nk52_evmTU46s2192
MKYHGQFLISILFVFGSLNFHADAQCEIASGDALWSSPSTWLSNSIPGQGDDVIIPVGETVVLVKSPPGLRSIQIDGTLKFSISPDLLSLNTQFIHVTASGKLQIGSEECPVRNKVHVNFYGSRNEFSSGTLAPMGIDPADGADLGVKGIAVSSGGSISVIGDNSRRVWTRLRATAEKEASSVSVAPGGTGWQVGDLIVISSTDFGPNQYWMEKEGYEFQTELKTVTGKSGDDTELFLNSSLSFMHYGKEDERGEVASLTRNILFTSTQSSSDFKEGLWRNDSAKDMFGAHIMIRAAKEAKFSSVEIANFGQKEVLGRYPIHFHQTGNNITSNFSHYVKGCSIHHSFQRGVVIHDSDNILVEDNVIYDIIGHGYFLEDGAEQKNIFLNNFGAVVKEVINGRLIPSENRPSVYWITNPNNRLVGNVAVDSFIGFWYSLPEFPNGLSTEKYSKTETVRPRYLPLLEFKGNVAHSMYEFGAMIDDGQNPDGTIVHATYTPRSPPYKQPFNSWGSQEVDAIFDQFLAYKCRKFGFWARGDHIVLQNSKLLGNTGGVLNPTFPGIVRDTLIVGESGNKGNPVHVKWLPDMNVSRPIPWSNEFPILGALGYDSMGPSYFQNIKFKGFFSNSFRKAGAFSVLRNGAFVLQPRNQMKGIQFMDESNRFYIEEFPTSYQNKIARDGPMNVNFMDVDGSVTGYRNGWVISNDTWMAYEGCELVKEWNAYKCPPTFRHYTFLELSNDDVEQTEFKNALDSDMFPYKATLHRLGESASNSTWKNIVGRQKGSGAPTSYVSNVLSGESYTFRFADGHPMPPSVTLLSRGLAPGEWVHVALPYPVPPTEVKRGGVAMAETLNIEDINDELYFYSRASQLLHIKMKATKDNGKKIWGFEDYTDNANSYSIRVPCSGSACSADTWQNPRMISPQVDLYKDVEFYSSNIGGCHVTTSPHFAFLVHISKVLSVGKAEFQYNRKTQELYFHIKHTISSDDVISAYIFQGPARQTGSALFELPTAQNPIRGRIAKLSTKQYAELAKGNFYVSIHTVQYPTGQARGQIICTKGAYDSECGPVIAVEDSEELCLHPSDNFMPIYTDQEHSFTLPKSTEVITTTHNVTTEKRCGDFSALIGLTKSNWYSIEAKSWKEGTKANSTKYTFLQFHAKKNQSGLTSGDNPLYLSIKMDDIKGNGGQWVNINSSMISNHLIVASEWSVVRIPLSELGLDISSGIRRIVFRQYEGWKYGDNGFFIDELGLIAKETDKNIFEYRNSSVGVNTELGQDCLGGFYSHGVRASEESPFYIVFLLVIVGFLQ